MAKVLVVDDAVLDQKIAGGCVEQEGSTPIYAENGRIAVEMIEQEHPDIVLTDLQMPEMDGLELVKHVRQNYPKIPVILMTAYGSEEIAAKALRTGASSYVPKKNLKKDLSDALRIVLQAAETAREREHVRELMRYNESRFLLGYEPAATRSLISHLQDGLTQMDLCDEADLIRVGTALTEALRNAIDHGNLELDSKLRENPDGAYYKLGEQRSKEPPFCDRRVHVTAKLTPGEAAYVIRDEGPGFDPSKLPDPRDPENLTKPSGRGILLIQMFMDEVSFNDSGTEITMIKRPGNSSDDDE